jgi:hypothetical protein
MAVCKRCGCAIPIGSKTCDMCAVVGSIAPVNQPQVWQAPKDAAGPAELASSAGSWAASPGVARPLLPADVQKAEKEVKKAWHWLAFVGSMYIVLGMATALGYMDDLSGLFGWWAVGVGASFLTLAYFVRRGEILALVIAIAIYTLYTIAFFAVGSFAFLRIIVLAWLLRSLLSMYSIRQHRRAQAQQAPATDQKRVA